jgi:hypothetical protein
MSRKRKEKIPRDELMALEWWDIWNIQQYTGYSDTQIRRFIRHAQKYLFPLARRIGGLGKMWFKRVEVVAWFEGWFKR